MATVIIVLAAIVFAMGQFHATQDDSFISFRYAKNLVDLGSLTFNGPGHDRVEGYSNFTWCMLLAGAYAIGIGPWLAAKLLGVVCLVATILGAMRLTDELLGARSAWRWFAALAIASSGCTTFWAVEGLETPLVAALVVWSLAFVLRALREPDERTRTRRAWLAGATLGVLGISRPETAVFGGVALAAVATYRLVGRERMRGIVGPMAIAFVVPVALQTVFRVLFYGRITANTVYAKVRGGGQLWRGRVYAEQFVEAHGTWIVVSAAVLVVAAVAVVAWRGRRELRGPAIAIAFVAAYVVFIVTAGGDWMRGFRFFEHVLPAATAFFAWAVATLATAMRGELPRPLRFVVLATVTGLVVLSNAVLAPRHPFGSQGAVYDGSSRVFEVTLSVPRGPHWRVGRWLRDNLAPGSLVALSEAGIVPFECGLPVLDYLGLNDRQIADLMQRGASDEEIADHVLRQRPRAIVITGTSTANGEFTGRLTIDQALQRHPDVVAHYRVAKVEPLAAPAESGTLAFAIFVRPD